MIEESVSARWLSLNPDGPVTASRTFAIPPCRSVLDTMRVYAQLPALGEQHDISKDWPVPLVVVDRRVSDKLRGLVEIGYSMKARRWAKTTAIAGS